MTIEVLDPTFEKAEGPRFERATRPSSLDGLTVGIVSNGKKGTQPFFEALARELEQRHGAAKVEMLTKANYSAPAETAVMDAARKWNALVSGIGD